MQSKIGRAENQPLHVSGVLLVDYAGAVCCHELHKFRVAVVQHQYVRLSVDTKMSSLGETGTLLTNESHIYKDL